MYCCGAGGSCGPSREVMQDAGAGGARQAGARKNKP